MKTNLPLAIILFLSYCISISAQDKGHLVIIGGGEKTQPILQKIIDFAGGKDSKIIIIPNASSVPEEAGQYTVDEFKYLGCTNVDYILFKREEADNDSIVNKLSDATGIFFSGGDQSYLTRDMLGTKLLDRVFQIYNSGGVISGTSAGAAVMSEVMITGNELINKDSSDSFVSIQKNNIEVKPGFGFIKTAFIDQHFIKRKRLNRTISVVLEYPKLIGIGIDESTSIIVNPDETFEVLGENQVIVFNATNCNNIKTDNNGNFGAENIKMDILLNGDKFDLRTKSVIE
jgi:cyanophycinase